MARRMMPAQRPGTSKQDYGTPDDFIAAVEKRFGKLDVDLAANAKNAKAKRFVTEQENSLSISWHEAFSGKTNWLNPPFSHIEPWAAKCAKEGRHEMMGRGVVLFLTPASVGSNWFADHVNKHALVLALQGRLCFDGKNPYPKDCVLSVFGPTVLPGFGVWDWCNDL